MEESDDEPGAVKWTVREISEQERDQI